MQRCVFRYIDTSASLSLGRSSERTVQNCGRFDDAKTPRRYRIVYHVYDAPGDNDTRTGGRAEASNAFAIRYCDPDVPGGESCTAVCPRP